MKKLLLFCLSLILVGCASVRLPTLGYAPLAAKPPYDAWTYVLKKYVDEQGRIDFASLAKDRGELDRFVAYVTSYGPNTSPEYFPTSDHVLAYHLNTYNALAMYKVIESGIPQTLAGFQKVSFFFLGKVQVGGQSISLYDYENKVIRPLGDARAHVALNCMSVACPRLPREAFLPQTVNQQLNREARLFVNEARNVSLDSHKQVLYVSEIFKFYTEDFLKDAPTLAAWINRYREDKVAEPKTIEFIAYDWTINRQPEK
jgi:hypothetical protein